MQVGVVVSGIRSLRFRSISERNLIRERTLAGLTAARARGRVGGRKSKLNDKQIREIRALLVDPAAHVKDIAACYSVSRTTLYKRVGVVQPASLN